MRICFSVLILISFSVPACKKGRIIPSDDSSGTPIGFTVRASVQIGDVIYDSIPASLHIRSWNANGRLFEKDIQLSAGENFISVSSAYTKNELTLTTWGISETKIFLSGMITEGMRIRLGGFRAAKKIRSLIESKESAVGFQEVFKTDYEYNVQGKIQRIKYYEKNGNSSWSLHSVEKIQYVNGMVSRTEDEFYNGADPIITEFYYDGTGRVEAMTQTVNGIDITAGVDYIFQTKPMINIDYLYSNGQFNTYTMEFKGGNVIQDLAVQNFSSNALRKYAYDLNINPFIHLKLPNFFLSNENKNNKTKEIHTYVGSVPTGIPYEYNYQYSSDGYPVEVLVKYKSPISGNYQGVRLRQFLYY